MQIVCQSCLLSTEVGEKQPNQHPDKEKQQRCDAGLEVFADIKRRMLVKEPADLPKQRYVCGGDDHEREVRSVLFIRENAEHKGECNVQGDRCPGKSCQLLRRKRTLKSSQPEPFRYLRT